MEPRSRSRAPSGSANAFMPGEGRVSALDSPGPRTPRTFRRSGKPCGKTCTGEPDALTPFSANRREPAIPVLNGAKPGRGRLS